MQKNNLMTILGLRSTPILKRNIPKSNRSCGKNQRPIRQSARICNISRTHHIPITEVHHSSCIVKGLNSFYLGENKLLRLHGKIRSIDNACEGPFTKAILNYLLQQGNKYNLIPHTKRDAFINAQFHTLISYSFPYATSENYQLAADLIFCLYAQDRIIDKSKLPNGLVNHFNNILLELLLNPNKQFSINDTLDPVIKLHQDFFKKVSDCYGARSEAFFTSYRNFLVVKTIEINLKKNHAANIEDYMSRREYSSGCDLVFHLGYLMKGLHITSEKMNGIMFASGRQLSTKAIYLANDILGFFMEYEESNIDNIVILLEKTAPISHQEALTRSLNMLDETALAFEMHSNYIKKYSKNNNEPDLLVCNEVQKYWITGNLAWSFATERFKEVSNRREENYF
jgi:hypothetical protein